MTRRLWCELAWLGGDRPHRGVVIEIEDGRITGVDAAAPGPGDERRPGLTLPGFANGHSHAFHRALRGTTHRGSGTFWTWRDQMYRLAGRLDPTAYFRLARSVYAEMLLAGFTSVAEFHYLHHGPAGGSYDDPNEMGRTLIAAARDAGIRLTLLDSCYLHGGIGKPLDAVQRRFGDGSVEGWIARVSQLADEPGVVVGAAIHSVRACTPDDIAAIAEWAEERPLHSHVSEQPAENGACLAAYGVTPVGLLAREGALARRFTAVHATHLTPDDRSRLGEARSTICVCPTTERDLADGIGEMRELVDAGCGISVGTDSNAMVDAFEEARAVEMHERLRTGERGRFTVPELMGALTDHGSIGWPDAGRIEPGMRADLVTVGLGSVRLAGATDDDALAALVFAGTAADVTTVTVDGVDRVTGSVYTAGDPAAEYAALLPRLAR